MKIPQNVMNLFNDPEATKILTSTSNEGVPHSIVVGSFMAPSDDALCVGEVLMRTTSQNLENNKIVSALAVKGTESYQIVASVKERQVEGTIFENISAELAKLNLPCRGVWMFEPKEIYNQSAGPDAGKKIG